MANDSKIILSKLLAFIKETVTVQSESCLFILLCIEHIKFSPQKLDFSYPISEWDSLLAVDLANK